MMGTNTARLRERINQRPPLLVPGAYNASTALMIQEVGFEAAYVSGAGISNAFLGLPDLGFMTLSELAAHVMAIREVVSIPLIVDADTGYGNALNVYRTVGLLERSGANAIQLEDQNFPKKCGQFEGKTLISKEEMCGKIRAALDARKNEDFLIIARTDSREVLGFEKALDRANSYAEAGADVTFVEAPLSEEEIAEIPMKIPCPQLINMVEGGKTPLKNLNQLSEMGYSIVLYANAAFRGALLGTREVLLELKGKGTTAGIQNRLLTWEERQSLVKKDFWDNLSERY